jgi:hypothetical protein
MRMRCPAILTLSFLLGACGDDGGTGGNETGSETADTGTGTDVADEVGTSDASTSTTSEDSTTTTTTTTDTDADADAGCPVGSENCPCTQGGGCDPGLECIDGLCTPPAPDTTGPDTTGPDTSTTDPTTDGGGACNMDVSFEIMAVDATAADGWDPFMSMLGEGMVMAWDNQTQDATISWDLDIPCDDTWHVWVRGVDQGQADSYFVMIDGEPNPPPIFELECTQGPQQATYVWNELNYRDPMDGACEYLFDPWTQDWAAGVHQLTLMYRESAAVSRIWVTNTAGTPP